MPHAAINASGTRKSASGDTASSRADRMASAKSASSGA